MYVVGVKLKHRTWTRPRCHLLLHRSIWVNYKFVHFFQPTFILFSHLNNAWHNLVIELCHTLTVVDTIQGDIGFLEAKKTSKKKIFIWWKQARLKISCDVFHFFIDIYIIGISFGLYLSVGSESIKTHTLSTNRDLFNEWLTQKWIAPNEIS